MNQENINEHAEIIANHVFHSFPYKQLIPNFKGPHAEDCEGCVVEAEVEKLVTKLNSLSHVEDIIADLERERHLRELLSEERHLAFKKAGIDSDGKSVTELVESLVEERDRLRSLLSYVRDNIGDLHYKIEKG
jgi:hypothetical protein